MTCLTSPNREPVSSRSRLLLAGALMVTITLGLLSRRYPLPGILAEYTGDALYTVAAFLALAMLFAAARTRALAGLAFACSAAVEFSQLLSWPWLGELRATTMGRLVLGSGFQWADLLAYLVGACTAMLLDLVVLRPMSASRNFCGGMAPAPPSDR